jgi:hypothetical protein
VCVAVLLMLAGASARGDEAGDARSHYETGQRLYDQGRYDEAIGEFETAYRLKPHPNVLYNIAQAHERLLEYGESVKWFERYLAEAPPDAEFRTLVLNRLRVLRGLPARISVNTIPEHVHAKMVAADGSVQEADAPTVFKIPAGAFKIVLSHAGWESESHDGSAELGQPYFYQWRLKRSTSRVTIFSRPRGARVFVDDKLVGETPYADVLEVGKHRLLLEHPDYPWFRREIEVRAGEPLELEIKLSKPIRSGRTELVLASMIYGGVAGPLLVVAAAGSNSDFITSGAGLAVLLTSSALGIGAGFLGSFLTTKEGIKVGHSSMIIGSGAWGGTLGASLSLAIDLPTQYTYGLGLLGSAIGITTGALIVHWKDVMPGTAAIYNSGGFWGAATGALLTHAIWSSPTGQEFGWCILGSTALGMITSSLVAWKVDRTRGHVAIVDAGGLVGAGLGFALGVGIGAGTKATSITQEGSRYAIGGLALGILAAAVASRRYKGDLPPVEALLRHENGRLSFGIPKLDIELARTPEGTAPRFVATLAKGSF